jgi:hypothetical protein
VCNDWKQLFGDAKAALDKKRALLSQTNSYW